MLWVLRGKSVYFYVMGSLKGSCCLTYIHFQGVSGQRFQAHEDENVKPLCHHGGPWRGIKEYYINRNHP